MSYRFQGQRSGEEVLLLTRQHPFVLLHPLIVSTLVALLPVALLVFMNVTSVWLTLSLVAVAAASLHGFLAWYSWSNSMLLLTNERVVLLEQRHFFHREFIECGLGSIQQVSHQVKGMLHTVFGFGNIVIYTGGSQQPFLLPNVPEPYDVQQEILRSAAGEGFVEE